MTTAQRSVKTIYVLLAWALGATILVFIALELWRPCYFLTDDNLSYWFPLYTEMGRRLQAGHSPFYSDYLFGGGYCYLRDLNVLRWHPFILGPALLADSFAKFWLLDIQAFLLLVLTTVGFLLLACRLRDEFSLKISGVYLIFYTLSFVFSAYALEVGPSWIDFLAIQSTLPWLALGILERRLLPGLLLVAFFTVHELLSSYAPLVISSAFFLTVFAVGAALWRRSVQPLFGWCMGNALAILCLFPFLLSIMDGMGHSVRLLGLPKSDLTMFSIPARTFTFSFFLGNWSEPVAIWQGDKMLKTVGFPFTGSILACAAAWCIFPAICHRGRWRILEATCLGIVVLLFVFIVRPNWLETILYQLPFFRSMRWPFRESVVFLFFFHVLLVLRFPEKLPRVRAAVAALGFILFIAPLPFIRVPSFNPLALDRELLFSGKAQRYWSRLKTQLKPTDKIIAAIDWPYWQANSSDIPYTLLGTANFPAYFQVRSASAYAPTAPIDQIPLKTIPRYWFGAFHEDQIPAVLAEQPGLKILRIVSTHPLKLTITTGSGPAIDLTPDLQAAGIKEAEPASPTAH